MIQYTVHRTRQGCLVLTDVVTSDDVLLQAEEDVQSLLSELFVADREHVEEGGTLALTENSLTANLVIEPYFWTD